MTQPRCPGQDMRYWKPEDIFEVRCPWCETEIEFWKDEPLRVCRGCGKEVRNPKIDLSCAKWCNSAEDCVGDGLPEVSGNATLEHQVIREMRAAFADDQWRIERAAKLLGYAERILRAEGGDPLVVRAAAILLEVDAAWADRSSKGELRDEHENSCKVRAILKKLGVADKAVEEICGIVDSCQSGQELETPAFRIVRDAAWLVKISEEPVDMDPDDRAALIQRVGRTKKGRELAESTFSKDV